MSNLDELIAEARAAGDTRLAIRLQGQRLGGGTIQTAEHDAFIAANRARYELAEREAAASAAAPASALEAIRAKTVARISRRNHQ